MTETFQTPPALSPDYSYSADGDSPWSAKGRFGRLSYLAWTMVLGFIALGVVIVLALFGAIIGLHGIGSYVAIGLLLLIPFIYFMIVFQIRRLHDLNRTGWWAALPFADGFIGPILNLIFHSTSLSVALTGLSFVINLGFTFYLMLAKGTDGANDHGHQRSTPQWEKVLGWLNIGCLILGVVVIFALGIPAYHHYQQKVAAMQQFSSIAESEPMTPQPAP